VLAAIVTRVREPAGGIPLVSAYDPHEAVWNPPMPLLFQWHWRLEDRPLSAGAVRRLLNDTLAGSGLTDASGAPLRFTPHDFRRLFITDAVMQGMPPHIAQLVAGHRDINTTMGYKNSQELHQPGEKPQVSRSQDRRNSVPLALITTL
jgi:integrase